MEPNDVLQQLDDSLAKIRQTRATGLNALQDAAQRLRFQQFYDKIEQDLIAARQNFSQVIDMAKQQQQQVDERIAQAKATLEAVPTPPAHIAPTPRIQPDRSLGERLRTALVQRYFAAGREPQADSESSESIGREDWQELVAPEPLPPTSRTSYPTARPKPADDDSESIGRSDWTE